MVLDGPSTIESESNKSCAQCIGPPRLATMLALRVAGAKIRVAPPTGDIVCRAPGRTFRRNRSISLPIIYTAARARAPRACVWVCVCTQSHAQSRQCVRVCVEWFTFLNEGLGARGDGHECCQHVLCGAITIEEVDDSTGSWLPSLLAPHCAFRAPT